MSGPGISWTVVACVTLTPRRERIKSHKNFDSGHQTNTWQQSTMADRTRSYHGDGLARNSRSQSPHRHRAHSHRTRSPHRSHHKRRHHAPETAPADLPYSSRPLTKRDYPIFRPMFGLYLDIQKGKNLDDLDEVEVKGRWKSFIGKW
jgi:hypothetical protein